MLFVFFLYSMIFTNFCLFIHVYYILYAIIRVYIWVIKWVNSTEEKETASTVLTSYRCYLDEFRTSVIIIVRKRNLSKAASSSRASSSPTLIGRLAHVHIPIQTSVESKIISSRVVEESLDARAGAHPRW